MEVQFESPRKVTDAILYIASGSDRSCLSCLCDCFQSLLRDVQPLSMGSSPVTASALPGEEPARRRTDPGAFETGQPFLC